MGYLERGLARNSLSLEFELFWNLQTCYKSKINSKLNVYRQCRFTRWAWQSKSGMILGPASEDGCQEIIEILIKTRNFSIHDYNVALQGASSNGHVEVVQLLLSLGANELDRASYLAEQEGHTQCAELLKKYGADSVRGRFWKF